MLFLPDVIVRGSVSLSPDSLHLNVPPPAPPPHPLCGLRYFISLVSWIRVNLLSSPHTLPVQKPHTSATNTRMPIHTLISTARTHTVHVYYSNPSFTHFKRRRSFLQSVHILPVYLKLSASTLQFCAYTHTYFSKSCALSWIHNFEMTWFSMSHFLSLTLSWHLLSIPHFLPWKICGLL